METKEMETKEMATALKEFCENIILGESFPINMLLFENAADRLRELESEKENLIHYNADLNNQLNKAEAHIEMLEKQLSEKQNRWISVEERLPEKDGYYLVANDDDRAHFTTFAAGNFISCGVTHWMPLPEPPKPKEPTFKDKFLEMFPKAELNNFRVPVVCAGALFSYLKDSCNTSDCSYNGREYQEKCYVCWSQPYFEEEGVTDGNS